MKRAPLALLIAATLVAGVTMSSLAGPPLICHPFEIDNAKSLPWGSDAWRAPRKLKSAKLVGQVLEHLDPSMPAIVRMETIRRAVIACGSDSVVGRELLTRLMARALDAEAAGGSDAMAWFDAGFLAQSMDQFGVPYVRGLGNDGRIIGYAWISRALSLKGSDDPQMNFAAALVTALYDQDKSAKHMDIARAGAENDRLLAVNIRRFEAELSEHLDNHRRNYRRNHGG